MYVCPSVILGLHKAAMSDIGSDTSVALTFLKQIKDVWKIRCVENKKCGKWKLKGQ